MTTPDAAIPEFLAEYPPDTLYRILRPISFAIGGGQYRSSCGFDRVLIKALLGDLGPLAKLYEAFEVRRAGTVLAGFGVNYLDAWAFDRADFVAFGALPLLGRFADFGMLKNARQPDTGRTLAHALVDCDQGPDMWKILARGEVNFDLRDNMGRTALCQARDNGNARLMCTLFELGADPTVIEMTQAGAAEFIADFAQQEAQQFGP
jgi:hypothetical protein